MNRFLKLKIEPLLCNKNGEIIDETSNVACIDVGSCGSGEYLFNIDALDFFPSTNSEEPNPIDQYALDSRKAPMMVLNAGATSVQKDDHYNGIVLQFATKSEEEGECFVEITELFGYGDVEDAIQEINTVGNFGSLTTVEQVNDAVFAAHRIWADVLQTTQANTKLAIEVSGNIFKGKVFSSKGDPCHLVGWEFIHVKS
tara:strand:+ start:2715 stop:3311 length:597 start_codon:yes stop_codon:yes gene_type:complete